MKKLCIFAVTSFIAAGCAGMFGEQTDDTPRASRQQCDYAIMHLGELEVEHPLTDDQRQRIGASEAYTKFMRHCERASTYQAQCVIDATSTDQAKTCKF